MTLPRRLLVDVAPFRRSPAFRRYWIGAGLSAIGTQMTLFAVTYQVFTLTGSSLAVGGIGLCAAVPALAFGMLGGSIGDAGDRRKTVLKVDGRKRKLPHARLVGLRRDVTAS